MRIGRPVVGVLVAAIAATAGSQSRGVRYGPGVCGPIDPVYVKASTETGGQPFPLSTAEVALSARVMEASFMPQMLLWASGDSELSYSIPGRSVDCPNDGLGNVRRHRGFADADWA